MTSSVRDHALYAALLSTILVLTSCRPDTTQSMREARARYSARDFAGSAEIYARIVKHEPRNGEALYGLGLARHESGDLAGAEWALARCIDLVSAKSEKVDAMVRLTDLYLARHADNPAYFEGAVKMAGLVTQWDPNLPAGHRLQGRIARIRGDRSAAAGNQNDAREFYRTSIDEYNRAAKLAPGDERVFAELASTEEAAGDYKSARDTYKRVLAIDPHACEPYDRLFVIETEHGTPDAAGSALNEAVAAPGCGTAFLEQMAETCIRLNKPAWFQTVADKLEHSETSTAGRLKLGSL